MSDGISRVEEQEEPIDPKIGRMCVAEPGQNVRQVFDWKGLKLELDETIYDFGTSYEIECESKEPEKDKKLIEGLLKDNGIEFSYSGS
ncbi:hypothetical protein H0E87_005992 [Populus deltoides]|uniref:CYTH domain-containing protein n=1 Tax=Populus deltoides TaxID=3696 RepID=A0A8T2Z565_POPDE|nr:hypothetical protein H0E87_005992 [Populus deltoides]